MIIGCRVIFDLDTTFCIFIDDLEKICAKMIVSYYVNVFEIITILIYLWLITLNFELLSFKLRLLFYYKHYGVK